MKCNPWPLSHFVPAKSVTKESTKNDGGEIKKFYEETCLEDNSVQHIEIQPSPSLKTDKKIFIPITVKLKKDFFKYIHNDQINKIVEIIDSVENVCNLIHMTDQYSWTPLMCAVALKNIKLVSLLLSHNAISTLYHSDAGGMSALSIAQKNSDEEMIKLLSQTLKPIQSIKCDDIQQSVYQPKIDVSLSSPKKSYYCEICCIDVADKLSYLSSISHLFYDNNTNPSTSNKYNTPTFSISSENVGYKMLKTVGWEGIEGLGPTGHGRLKPVELIRKYNRYGLGHKPPKIKPPAKSKKKFSKFDESEFRRSFKQ